MPKTMSLRFSSKRRGTIKHCGLIIILDASREILSGFPTRFDTNRAAQPHKMAICVKFKPNLACLGRRGSLHYQCSENKWANQLRGSQKAGFLMTWLIMVSVVGKIFLKL